MNLKEAALNLHKKKKGKIEVVSKVNLKTQEDLTLAYTPGVAEVSKIISENKDLVYDYTSKWNLVAIVSDGSAVLGLGDIGPEAALPVMEGKAILFKQFANVDAFPICLATKNIGEIVDVVRRLEPTFGGINLEDISAPRCFEIEQRLKKELNIPVFHDDQDGSAIVVLAGLTNALKIVDKRLRDIKIVINGAGAGGIRTAQFLINSGAKNVILCDSAGVIYEGRRENMNVMKERMVCITNPERIKGELKNAMKNADVFIGLSKGGLVNKEMIRSMDIDPIVFAMANPLPEIMPQYAKEAGARIVATGRSDFPNQINNVLAFPGIFRGTLDVRAKTITEEMKIAAAKALAGLVEEPNEECIIPNVLDKTVAQVVASAVSKAYIENSNNHE